MIVRGVLRGVLVVDGVNRWMGKNVDQVRRGKSGRKRCQKMPKMPKMPVDRHHQTNDRRHTFFIRHVHVAARARLARLR